jgi:hypothetical protein
MQIEVTVEAVAFTASFFELASEKGTSHPGILQ